MNTHFTSRAFQRMKQQQQNIAVEVDRQRLAKEVADDVKMILERQLAQAAAVANESERSSSDRISGSFLDLVD